MSFSRRYRRCRMFFLPLRMILEHFAAFFLHNTSIEPHTESSVFAVLLPQTETATAVFLWYYRKRTHLKKMRYLRGGLNGTNMCCVLLTLLNRSLLPLFLEAHSWWIWIQWGFFCQMPSDFRVDGHEKKLNPSIMDWAIFVVPTAQCEREVPVVDDFRFPP